MIRTLSVLVLGIAAIALTAGSYAADEKGGEKTLKGTITCAKCDLKKEKACTTVIVVKEKDKDVIYYFDKESGKKYHGDICTEAKEGTVKGSVKKDGQKMVVTVTELEFKK
jgi:Family of unknown function (DUF6370)